MGGWGPSLGELSSLCHRGWARAVALVQINAQIVVFHFMLVETFIELSLFIEQRGPKAIEKFPNYHTLDCYSQLSLWAMQPCCKPDRFGTLGGRYTPLATAHRPRLKFDPNKFLFLAESTHTNEHR